MFIQTKAASEITSFSFTEGNQGLKDDVKFDLCFGGRRQFCDEVYADLGENMGCAPVC